MSPVIKRFLNQKYEVINGVNYVTHTAVFTDGVVRQTTQPVTASNEGEPIIPFSEWVEVSYLDYIKLRGFK